MNECKGGGVQKVLRGVQKVNGRRGMRGARAGPGFGPGWA